MISAPDQELRDLSSALPRPGEVLHMDCRNSAADAGTAAPGQTGFSRPLRVVTWNIERGYKLDAVVAELQRIDADVIALQEVDIGCERSSSKDTGKIIAEALRMDYAFLCEFEELHSPLRDAMSQGGGVHGNAILSRYSLSDIRVIQHRHHPVDWENPAHPLAQREPRHGRRAVLAATATAPQGPILVYCLHLEVFCGMLARVAQFADVLRDSKKQLQQGIVRQIILGDLNTMGHGVARLSPNYCCDPMRWRTLGWYEAAWWHAHVLSQEDAVFSPERDAVRQPGEETTGRNVQLQRLGLREDVCEDVLNPGFVDPFDPVRDVTLDNPAYRLFGRGLMKGKLDWLLLRRLAVSATDMGNHDYGASDHKWLSADVTYA